MKKHENLRAILQRGNVEMCKLCIILLFSLLHHFYMPKGTKTFLNLLSFGTLPNTFIFFTPPCPPFEGGINT